MRKTALRLLSLLALGSFVGARSAPQPPHRELTETVQRRGAVTVHTFRTRLGNVAAVLVDGGERGMQAREFMPGALAQVADIVKSKMMARQFDQRTGRPVDLCDIGTPRRPRVGSAEWRQMHGALDYSNPRMN